MISNTTAENIHSQLFSTILYSRNINCTTDTICYSSNNVFSRFIDVIIPCEGTCFIPVLSITEVMEHISKMFRIPNTHLAPLNFVYPLYVKGIAAKKTGDSIFNTICCCGSNMRLAKITAGETVYYGGSGLIFNKNWKVMMVCGFMYQLSASTHSITLLKPVCYISPNVFESKDVLSKCIIKKVIPYITKFGIRNPSSLTHNSTITVSPDYSNRVEVIISDYPHVNFSTPVTSEFRSDINSDIWRFLSENIGII